MSSKPPSHSENVELLIEQIREAARLHRALPERYLSDGDPGVATQESATYLDSYLTELARRSQPRTELPHRFRRFPFTIAPIGRFAVRIYNLLTKEQRGTNIVLRDALRALQSVLARSEKTARDESVLHDYIRAQLTRGPLAPGGNAAVAQSVTAAETQGLASGLDAFFVALGDRFRGPPELVTERLSVYLPTLRSAGLAGPALDLGCGRGEWLALMREAKIQAVGVDHNRLLLDHCVGQGHQVIDADLAAFVEQSPADHWQIVTAFHVIEHLGWPAWHVFLQGIHRILRPGGMAIIETPNPGNLFTAANRFHLDPTHRQPVPDLLLEFAAKHAGFVRVDIVPLHPESELAEQSLRNNSTPEAAERLFGARDYAIIARK